MPNWEYCARCGVAFKENEDYEQLGPGERQHGIMTCFEVTREKLAGAEAQLVALKGQLAALSKARK